jgi:hypothetical protein
LYKDTILDDTERVLVFLTLFFVYLQRNYELNFWIIVKF